ncbi:MAG TPA: TonB family protein [Candidatus Aquilonibacter sp.]|nr:TonB family protein [Candidatus Aquilonibacter sp.]
MPEAADSAPVQPVPEEDPGLRLLVELPSRPRVFFGNLRELFRRRDQPLNLLSAPAPFWPDVFVPRGLPWRRFFQSSAYHGLAFGLIWAISGFLALQPQAVPRPAPVRDEVIYYTPEEYLPPLDTRQRDSDQAQKAEPEYSRQAIISLPPEADNRSQTIVTPPAVNLKQNLSLPNIVAWAERPKLPIAPAPVVQAASLSRLAPSAETSVIAPAPDLPRAEDRPNRPALQTSVVAPPPDVQDTQRKDRKTLGIAVIAPPPVVAADSTRRMGDLSIARSAVIAPAPRLFLEAQRAVSERSPGRAYTGQQVIAPPPAMAATSTYSGNGGRRMIALNLHPAIGAPPDLPAGNRRGSFAATPEGRAGASGSPGSASGEAHGTAGDARNKTGRSTLPPGLYVGKAPKSGPTSPVAGNQATAADLVNPNLIASLRPPRISSLPARSLHPENETRLTEEERAVFHDRKFYSLTLNMPNLNSAGGSWVVRFAELKRENSPASSSADLSAPSAIRKVDPAYPLELMRQNVGGTVILLAVIHADGTVGDVRVLRSVDDRLDRYASDALAQWRFNPATKAGVPVDVEATFRIPFHPVRAQSAY